MSDGSQQQQGDSKPPGLFRRIGDFLGTLAGKISALAGAVIAVAGAWAVLRGDEPTERAGDIVGVTVDQQVSLDEFQERGIGAPRKCRGFRRPDAASAAARAPSSSSTARLPLAAAPPFGGGLAQDATPPGPLPDGVDGDGPPPATETDATDTDTTTTTTPDGTDTDGTGRVRAAGKLLAETPLPPRAELAPRQPAVPEQVASSVRLMELKAGAEGLEQAEEIAARPDLSLAELNQLLEQAAPALVGNVVNFVVRIRGLKGKCTYVSAALFDSRTRVRLREPFAAPRDALFFIPRTPNDQTRHEVWVPRPRSRGSYFVRLELFDHSGEGLNFDERARFRVPIG